MTYTPSTEQVRQWANSYDGCPTDVFDRWLAAHDAEVRADERAKIVGRLRGTGPTWEAVVAELAKIAERNMPGWDAGEMAITALRIVGERIVEAGR